MVPSFIHAMFKHKFKYLFILLLALYSFLNIIILEGDRLYQAALPIEYLAYTIIFLVFSVWMVNLFIQHKFLTYFNSIHPLLIQFIISIASVIVISAISVELSALILGKPFTFTTQNFLLTFAFTFRINLFLNTLNAIVFFNNKYQQQKLEAEKLKSLNSASKLEQLNYQLNPHFLFNNLNVLSGLIHYDTEQADAYLQKLATIYRYITSNLEQEVVRLEEEVAFIKDYIGLLEIRFKESLSFSIEIDDHYKKFYVPPVVLQLLVENIVKHNYFTSDKPLKIFISTENDFLVIRNPIQARKKDETESMGIGLKNISERYRFLGKSIEVNDSDNQFIVKVPLLEIL